MLVGRNIGVDPNFDKSDLPLIHQLIDIKSPGAAQHLGKYGKTIVTGKSNSYIIF